MARITANQVHRYLPDGQTGGEQMPLIEEGQQGYMLGMT